VARRVGGGQLILWDFREGSSHKILLISLYSNRLRFSFYRRHARVVFKYQYFLINKTLLLRSTFHSD
jgi:hypothetical protein